MRTRSENIIEASLSVVMNNMNTLSDEQLSNLAFQVWAATQERRIMPFEGDGYER